MPIRPTGNITQDWDPVVLSRRKPKGADLKDPKAVNNAIRSGAAVETSKKFDAGSNKKGSSAASQPAINARKLDEQTEPAAFDRVPADLRIAIQKARIAKKMSQAELAKQINERVQVVQEYESGKAFPNAALLGKMERVLGVKLRGRNNYMVVFGNLLNERHIPELISSRSQTQTSLISNEPNTNKPSVRSCSFTNQAALTNSVAPVYDTADASNTCSDAGVEGENEEI